MEIVRTNIDRIDFKRADDIGFHRYDILLVLKFPLNDQELFVCHQATILLVNTRSNNGVGNSCLIFEAQENETLGCSWPLPGDYASCDPSLPSVSELCQIAG